MSVQALMDYTFVDKYARFRKDLGRRETYEEAVDRVIAMHAKKYEGYGVENELKIVEEAMKSKLILGSQRALQFGGAPILKKSARLYNCSMSYCDRPRFFQEALWLLLCGCGVGFSAQIHHVAKLPELKVPKGEEVFIIPDSIEGWSDALGRLMAAYGIAAPEFEKSSGVGVKFDYSLIRPKGSPLSSSSGKAPGPEPLKLALTKIEVVLKRSGVRLRPIDAYDILMHASDAVLSGGVRRSATMCLFSYEDKEMTLAKTGTWQIENPQRGRSNNSVLLLRDKVTKRQFTKIMQSVKEYGEPGFMFSDSTEIVYNPCGEVSSYPISSYDESGWALCNLCEINAKLCTNPEVWKRACTAASILGTLQAGYTDFPYLGEVTERIVRREALLGVSMTGMMDSPNLVFRPELQREMAQHVVQVNEIVARKIGINPAARTTCVKPSGTASCLLGTSSGIHAHHAKRYFRRSIATGIEAPLQYYKAHNPLAVQKSVWSASGMDDVVTFCIEVEDEALTREEVSTLNLLEKVRLTQGSWIEAGRVAERCAHPALRHNVSNTISVEEGKWEEVGDYIFEHRKDFTGVALLPASGDRDYPQAPFCQVFDTLELLSMYGEGVCFASGLIVDGLHAFDNNLWKACDCALGIGEKLQDTDVQKLDWVRRLKKFSVNYLNGDLKKTVLLLKDLNNYHHWRELTRTYVPVDWTLLVEDSDATVIKTAECKGGKCVLDYA
jgi:ribonucleoside-diphosphate reductase alpha chain